MKLGTCGRTIHIGVIGLGFRGMPQLKLLLSMEDVCITAVCDVFADRVEEAQRRIQTACGRRPFGTTDYREVNRREDVEAVLIMTDWTTHIRIAVDAMNCGKIPGMEVGGASSLDECWQLVRTSENTGVPVMLLENCCYNSTEMALLNMIKRGIFGELVHCRGGYQHDLRDEIGEGDKTGHYRQRNFMHRNGELYPTHELGPIATYLNLNRGNRMLSLVSMASKGIGETAWLKENRQDNPALCKAKFNQGDIVTTMIKCANGETIMLTHDCTLPRPYSRGGYVQGSKGVWQEDNKGIFIEGMSPVDPKKWGHEWESDKKYMTQYEHPLWKEYREFGLRGGHGGMDYLVFRGFIEALQQGTHFPIDVYDTAAWMSITCLSEQSIAMGGMPVPFPDFTNGKWIDREPEIPSKWSLNEVY